MICHLITVSGHYYIMSYLYVAAAIWYYFSSKLRIRKSILKINSLSLHKVMSLTPLFQWFSWNTNNLHIFCYYSISNIVVWFQYRLNNLYIVCN
jgi:hypothetical protein